MNLSKKGLEVPETIVKLQILEVNLGLMYNPSNSFLQNGLQKKVENQCEDCSNKKNQNSAVWKIFY